jgi:hypothetical protein
MTRSLIVFLTLLLFPGCGLTPAAREREAANAKRRADHIAKLKGLVPANVLKDVDAEFYTHPGDFDWFRFPLVYPYAIRCIDGPTAGSLTKHDGKSKIADAREDAVQGMGGLTAFNFDARFLVGHMGNKENDPKWVLFEFATGKIDSYPDKEELAAAAKARGYTGDMELASVEAQYNACFK